MDSKLFGQALAKFFGGVVLLGLLVFLPAGTFHYTQGWIFMAALFLPMFIAGIVLMIKNPELLRKRLSADEEEDEQKTVLALSGIMFIAAFVIAGLNYRFDWFVLPMPVTIIATIIFLLAYVMYAEVLRENTYLSRTVEVQEDQKVIDTGLYGIVRHPMYTSTVVLFLAMPLILGSLISTVIMLAYIPIIAKRIKNEEEVLEQGLPGYTEYKQKVRCKLIPKIW